MNIEILNKYIEKKQISILQLSKLCEMDDRNLGKIIHGKTENPRIDTVVKIAKALKEVYSSAEIEYIPFPDALKGKYQKYTQADLKKLRNAGYDKSFMNVNTGVKKYAEVLEKSNGYLM